MGIPSKFMALVGQQRSWQFWISTLSLVAILGYGGWLVRQSQKRNASLPAPTPATDRAADFVRKEVESWGDTSSLVPEYLYALSAMNYVHARVSPGLYTRLSQTQQLPTPLDAEKCLSLEAGICGNHMDAFDKILSRSPIAVKRRSAEFYLHDEKNGANCSHVVGEVFYKGGWRLFDITSGTIFVRRNAMTQDDLLSGEEIRDLVKRGEPWRDLAVCNNASVRCRQYRRVMSDPYRYLEWPETDLIAGRNGTIRLRAETTGTRYSLQHMPTLLGHFEDYSGNIGNLRFCLDAGLFRAGPRGLLSITVKDTARVEGNVFFVVKNATRDFFRTRLSEITRDQVIEIDVCDASADLFVQIDSEHGLGSALVSDICVR